MRLIFIWIVSVAIAIELCGTNAELQGPVGSKIEETDANDDIVRNSQSSVSNVDSDSAESDSTMEPSIKNEGKSSNYGTDQTEQHISLKLTARTKLIQQALFERIWNEKLLKKKLEEQIELIELQRGTREPVDPTPEQIEAQSLFEEASAMIAKPNTDKRAALALIRKAANMNHLKARAVLAWRHLLGNGVELDFEFATSEFEKLAKEGVPEGNTGLGFLYSVGVGGKNVSQPLALIHFTLAALGDDVFAQMALGYRYSFGINVPVSCEKALMYYKRVAKKVASKVTFSNGPIIHRIRLLEESENLGSQETEIVDYYQLLADKGDVQSQVGLGQLYYQGGKAIQQDHQKALEYFTQAANAGNAIGYAFLGKLYLEGSDFIKADNETALKYFKKAAELGDPVGQSGLGLMYLNGLGVPKDSLKALNYFTQAADQGWVDGQLQLGNMYFTGNGVKTDYKLALKYFNLASQSGHVLAYYNLGIMHTYGIGMLRSCPAAVEFFKNVAERGRWSKQLMHAYNDYKSYRIDEAYMQYALLAELGYEVGQSNAAFLLDRGDVTTFNDRHEDLIRAFYYWKRAAAQGYSAAQVKLGDYYYYGWGTNVDFETAAALYRKASEQQYNAQAMFNLGYMHEQGLGMKKDWHLAKRLYDLAAETNTDAQIPVTIALLKLQLLSKFEAIKQSPSKFVFYVDENIAANWDLYMITVLTLLLGFIMYTRRPFQVPQQEPQHHDVNNADNSQQQNDAEPNSSDVQASPVAEIINENNASSTEDTPTQARLPLQSNASTSTESATKTPRMATQRTTDATADHSAE